MEWADMYMDNNNASRIILGDVQFSIKIMNKTNAKRSLGEIYGSSLVHNGIYMDECHELRIEYPVYTPPEDADDAMYGDYLLYLPRISVLIDDNKPKIDIEQTRSNKKSKHQRRVRFNMEAQIQDGSQRKLILYKERNNLLEEGLRKIVMRKRLMESIYAKLKRN